MRALTSSLLLFVGESTGPVGDQGLMVGVELRMHSHTVLLTGVKILQRECVRAKGLILLNGKSSVGKSGCVNLFKNINSQKSRMSSHCFRRSKG